MARQRKWLTILEEFVGNVKIDSKEISAVDSGGVRFDLWDSQRRFLENIAAGLDDGVRIFYCLKSRQLGISTISLCIDIFWLAMHPGVIGALVTDTEVNREAFRATLRRYVESMPASYRGKGFQIVKDNRNTMSFSNGSRLDFLVAGTKKKANWGEGRGYAFCHITEASKFGDPEGLRNFEESFAQGNPDRLFIYESTANGMNHWRDKYYEGYEDPTTKRSFFIGWWAHPLNRIERDDPRFETYYAGPLIKEERERIDEVWERHHHEIAPEQLAWYRWRAAQSSMTLETMRQNQPWCVTAETRVGTDHGYLRIVDVRPGMRTAHGRVLAVMPTGTATIWRATTKLGYTLRGTGNHPLIDKDGARVELQASLGRTVRLQPPLFAAGKKTVRWKSGIIEHKVEITSEFARLVGLFMGDGSLSGMKGRGERSGYQFAIACTGRDVDVADECQRLIKHLFGVEAHRRHQYVDGAQGGCIDVRVSSKIIFETFKALGLLRDDVAVIRRKVHVPEFILQSPRHVIREFLSGLFEADGFNAFNTSRVVFATKWPEFAYDVQRLLLGFGITCRLLDTKARLKGKTFRAIRLELRKFEAERFNREIGFIGARKRNRFINRPRKKLGGARPTPLVFEDQIAAVVNEGRREEVYNVTVEGKHLFDANGILTHNTDGEAFVMSGFSFFAIRLVQQDIQRCAGDGTDDNPGTLYKGYKYWIGEDFFAVKCEQIVDVARQREIELRVWDEPVPNAQYVIGMDPAFGRNDWGDRHCISVWRCFGDRLVQVAEYATADVETRQAAWVLAHLAGAYRDCLVTIELSGGPGKVVMTEFIHMREMIRAEMYQKQREELGWEDFLANARWYLYHRPDSMGAGYAYNFETTGRTKVEIMNQMRDTYTGRQLMMRSIPLLNEMALVVQNGAEIGAPKSSGENTKDDRVFATALANRAWINWFRTEMIHRGYMHDIAMARESGEAPIEQPIIKKLVEDYFKRMEDMAAAGPTPPKWMVDRGLA